MTKRPDQIVFYDGSCGFCNHTVAHILRNDKKGIVHFAALQSGFAKKVFSEMNWSTVDLNTFYFLENGVLFERSTAALRLLKYLGAGHQILRLFYIIPKGIRDAVYNSIAKRRHRLAKGFCYFPNESEKCRFID